MWAVTWLGVTLQVVCWTEVWTQSGHFRRYGWTMKTNAAIGTTFSTYKGEGAAWPTPVDGPFGAGEAVRLDGQTDNYLTLYDASGTCLADVTSCASGFSLGMWMRDEYSGTSPPSTDLYFLSSGGQTMSSHGVFLRYRYGGEFYEAGVLTSGGTLWLVQFTFSVRWVWTYLLLTWESSAGLVVYADNAQVGADPTGTAVVGYSFSGPDPYPKLRVGVPNHRTASQAPMSVDEVAFWEAVVGSSADVADLPCHPGWFSQGSSCYKFSYMKDDASYDAAAAAAVCSQEGGDLAAFTSNADADFASLGSVRPDNGVNYFLKDCYLMDTTPDVAAINCLANTRYSICSSPPLNTGLTQDPQYVSGCFDGAMLSMTSGWALVSASGYSASDCRTACGGGTYKYAAILASSAECRCGAELSDTALKTQADCDGCRTACTDQYAYVFAVTKTFSQTQEVAFTSPQFVVKYHYGVFVEVGREFTVEVDGGGATVWQVEVTFKDGEDPVVTDAQSYVYQYDTAGTYNVTWLMKNSIDTATGHTLIRVEPLQEKLQALYVTADPSSPNASAVIYRKLLGGKNVTCELHYGDGYVDLWEEEDPAKDQTLNHTYTTAGEYELTLICDTVASIMQACGSITIMEEVSGGTTDAIVVATFGASIDFTWNITSGDAVSALVLIDDVTVSSTSTFDNASMSGTTSVAANQYSDPGTKAAKLIIYNLVSNINANATVIIERAIVGLEVTSTSYYWLNGSVIPLSVGISEGTSVDFIINFGDNLTVLESSCYSQPDLQSLTYNHTYPGEGVYEVQVTAANLVSYESKCVNITIERGLPPGFVFTPPNITTHVLENMTFTITAPNELLPDPIYYTLSTGDEYVHNVANAFDNGTTFNLSHYYRKHGQFFACAMVYTNTMAQNFSVIIQVEAGTVLNITADQTILKVDDDTVSFNLSGLSGVSIDYSLDFGDGSPEFKESVPLVYDPSFTVHTSKTYGDPGVYNVNGKGNGTYLDSSTSVASPIIVQRPLPVCCLEAINVPVLLVNPTAEMTYELQLTTNTSAATNVTCKFTFGEGAASEVKELVPLVYGSVYKDVSNVFTSEGVFTTEINCSNLVSYLTTSVDVKVVDLILDDIEIKTDSVLVLDAILGYADAVWKFNFHNQTWMPPGIMATWTFGDSSSSLAEPFSKLNHTHQFNRRGSYFTTLDLTFQTQRRHLNWTMEVGVLNLTAGPTLLRTFEEELVVRVSGLAGNASYMVNFGDGTSHFCSSPSASMTDVTEIKKVYTEDGVYVIEGMASNSSVKEKTSFQESIVVQHALTNVTFAGKSLVAVVPRDKAEFLFELKAGGSPPTNATCSVDYGDGSAEEKMDLDLGTSSQVTLIHSLPIPTEKPVVHQVKVNCSNRVDSHVYKANITAYAGLSGLTVSSKYPSLQVNVTNEYSLSLETGSNARFFIDFGDNQTLDVPAVDQRAIFNHSYITFGHYPVFVRAYNDYDQINVSLAEPISVYWFINVSIGDFNLTVDSPEQELDYLTNRASVTFTVLVQNAFLPPPNISLTWKYGDGITETEMMTSFTKTHDYVAVGEYTASLTVNVLDKNQVGTLFQKVTVYKPCLKPITKFDSQYQASISPLKVYKSKPVSITPVTTLRCDRAKKHHFRWVITDDVTGNVVMRVEGADATGVLALPKGTFAEGLYQVTHALSVDGQPADYSDDDSMYLKIAPTPLVVTIKGGSGMTMGKTDTLTLDASASYDPDDTSGSTSSLSFTWSCQTMNETELNSLAETDPTTPLNLKENCTKLATTARRRKRDISGVVDVQGESLEENTFSLFQVVVTSPDNRQTAARQAVQIVPGDPPNEAISCTINCNTKVNVHEAFGLTSQCDDCAGAETRVWELFQYSDTAGFEKVSTLSDMSLTGVNGRDLVLGPGTLQPGILYRAQLTTTRDVSGDRGQTWFDLRTNLPPYNPSNTSCTITPEQGVSLRDTFVLRCMGWEDEGDPLTRPGDRETSLNYEFSIQYGPDAETKVINYGSELMTPPLSLAPGRPDDNYTVTFHVNITDRYGASATTTFTAKVEPPYDVLAMLGDEEDYMVAEMIAAPEKLANILQTGDVKALMQEIAVLNAMFGQIEQPPDATEEQLSDPSKWAAGGLVDLAFSGDGGGGGGGGGGDGGGGDVDEVTGVPWDALWEQMINPPPLTKSVTAAAKLNEESLVALELAAGSLTPDSGVSAVTQTTGTLSVILGDGHLVTDEGLEKAVSAVGSIVDALSGMEGLSLEAMAGALTALVEVGGQVLTRAKVQENPYQPAAVETSEFGYDPVKAAELAVMKERSDISDKERSFAMDKLSAKTKYLQKRQKELQGKVAASLMDTFTKVSAVMARSMTPGIGPVNLARDGLQMRQECMTAGTLGGVTVAGIGAAISMSNTLPSLGDEHRPLSISLIIASVNPYSFGAGSDGVTSGVMRVGLMDQSGKPITMSEKLQAKFEAPVPVPAQVVAPVKSKGDDTGMNYNRLWVGDEPNALLSQLTVPRPPPGIPFLFLFYLRAEDFPSYTQYDHHGATLVRTGTSATLVVDPADLPKRSTSYFMGIKMVILLPASRRRKRAAAQTQHDLGNGLVLGDEVGGVSLSGYDVIDPQAVKDAQGNGGEVTLDGLTLTPAQVELIASLATTNYSVQTASSGCRAWDAGNETWTSSTCQVGGGSSVTESDCQCSQSGGSDFAASFIVMPNMIDFNMVFANWDPSNYAVLALCLGLMLLYVPAAVWARHRDKKDVLEWGVSRLVDNHPSHHYYYLVTVYTGLRKGAGTSSNVGFVLSGENEDTGIRTLKDGLRQEMKQSSVMRFLMAVPNTLGTLQYLRVWHDSAGKGGKASWYLDKVIVHDIQKDESYIFMCDQWLALDEDDGRIDRVLPAAGRENVMSFRNLFLDNAKLSVTDEHLWVSLVMRPTRSNFTRVQRLSCCMSLLFLTMIANAMFFGQEGTEARPMGVSLGPIKFTLGQVFIALASVIIITPVNILIISLFKKARPKAIPLITGKSADDLDPKAKVRQRQRKTNMKLCFPPCRKKKGGADGEEETPGPSDEEVLSKMLSSYVVDAKEKLWPHWVAYIAYALVVLSVLASAFFCILYSQQWGKVKASEWLGAFFLSFIQDFFILDPIKVVLLAIAMAVVFRKPALKLESVDSNALGTDEEYTENPHLEREITLQKPKPLGHQVLERLRRRRQMEKDLYSLMRDIVLYIILLATVWAISFGNRDPQAYSITDIIHRTILDDTPGTLTPEGFNKISNTKAFIEWIDSTFIPSFFASSAYNGARYHWRQRAFLDDLASFRVGPARFRQLRMGEGEADHYKFRNLTHKVYKAYDMMSEEDGSYCIGWKRPPCDEVEEVWNYTSPAWRFTPSSDVWGVPMWGKRKVYGGGGYIAELDVNQDVSELIMGELWRNQWIDRQTRAVFVEFTIYNANINLFGVVVLLLEYGEMGGVMPFTSYKVFRIYMYEGVFGLFMIGCQIVFVIFLLFSIFNEGRKLYRQRCAYFTSGWQVLELLTILGSVVGMGMFVLRVLLTSDTVRRFHHDPTRFVNFQHVATYDENMGYFLAVLVFLFTIKFLRILNFNKRVSAFLAVMQVGASDLTSYMILFVTVYLAFALCGYLYFGRYVADYSSIISSCEALLSTMLGKNQYADITRVSGQFGQAYFILYALLSAFGLVNLLVAILCDAIYNVRLMNIVERNRLELVDFVLHRLKESIGFRSSFDFRDSSRPGSGSRSSSRTSGSGSTRINSQGSGMLTEDEARARGLYNKLGTQVDQLNSMVWKDAERWITGDPWDCWADMGLMLKMYGLNGKQPQPAQKGFAKPGGAASFWKDPSGSTRV